MVSKERFAKLTERIEKLIEIYGISAILEGLIKTVDDIENVAEEDSPSLRLLSIDLAHTLRNYERHMDFNNFDSDPVEEDDECLCEDSDV